MTPFRKFLSKNTVLVSAFLKKPVEIADTDLLYVENYFKYLKSVKLTGSFFSVF